MGKITGFLEYQRKTEGYLPVEERTKNYKEFTTPLEEAALKEQGARCMNCGIPFCHSGCPLGNLIPDFNDAVYEGKWDKASEILHATNNFPEFTGRLCPAPCEEACVLGINEDPVSIENIEKNIAESAFKNGYIKALPPNERTEKKIAIIGSGPAGLATAQQLNRAGHWVTVYERDERVGGLLRFGIPDFKLEKTIIDRRIALLEEEGIEFVTGVNVGEDISASELEKQYDAIVLCGGAAMRRGLPIEGADLKGVVQAMDFLPQSNRRVSALSYSEEEISAANKHVIVIGGGDTGSDCIGTSRRQGAKSIQNFEIMPMATPDRPQDQPWPFWPMRLRESTSHKEGVNRHFSIMTKQFVGNEKGELTALVTVEVEWKLGPNKRMQLVEKEGSEKTWPCDMALLALGFTGSEKTLAEQFELQFDERGNVKATESNYQTTRKGVFAAGDQRRGQSLIVWAIAEGRQAAYHVDEYLMGYSHLPLKGEGDLPRL